MNSPELQMYFRGLARNAAVALDGEELRIWVLEERDFDHRFADDQELGDHRIMISTSGVLALTFDIERLFDVELQVSRARAHAESVV